MRSWQLLKGTYNIWVPCKGALCTGWNPTHEKRLLVTSPLAEGKKLCKVAFLLVMASKTGWSNQKEDYVIGDVLGK